MEKLYETQCAWYGRNHSYLVSCFLMAPVKHRDKVVPDF